MGKEIKENTDGLKVLQIMKTNFQGQNINIYNKHSHVFLPFLRERRASPHRRPGQSPNRRGTRPPCRQAPSPTHGRRTAIIQHGFPLTNCHNQIHHTGDIPWWRSTGRRATAARPLLCWSVSTAPTWAGRFCSSLGWPPETSDHRGGGGCTCSQLPQPTSTKSHGQSQRPSRVLHLIGISQVQRLDTESTPHVHIQINPTLLYTPRVHTLFHTLSSHPTSTPYIHPESIFQVHILSP